MPLKLTKNQTLVLQIFFNDPEKSYYLRELAKILGKQPGVFQKDINALAEKGILLSERVANSRFFKLNKSYPLYAEVKSIFFKTTGAQARLKKALETIKNIETAFIFGSFAKGDEDSISDIDLMIIGNPDENLLIPGISRIEKEINREVNYHIFSASDWSKKMEKEDNFLKNVSEGPKIFLIGIENGL